MSREAISPALVAAVIVAVLGLSALLYHFIWGRVSAPPLPDLPSPSPAPPPPPPMVAAPPPPPPALVLPELAASDELVRQLAKELSSHPDLLRWLATEGLIRRFVVVVDNVSRGLSPRRQLPFLEPRGTFRTLERNGTRVIAPRSFRRYDTFTAAVTSLDNEGMARLYRDLLPLFEEAYGELGNPDTFAEALDRAIDHLLATPIPPGDVEVEEKVTSWAFADPELEALSDAQKQLLRMGPKNARKVQAKLVTLKAALALTRGVP